MVICFIVGVMCLPNRSTQALKAPLLLRDGLDAPIAESFFVPEDPTVAFESRIDGCLGMASPGQGGVEIMYAIIETGGKQYKVQKGDVLKIEKVQAEAGDVVEVSNVLAVVDEKKTSFGKPLVQGAKVVLRVLEHGKGDKIIVYKYKPKKKYRRTQGHRQPYSKVVVESIING
jgi:large subunit ribosomal protein L21